MGTNNSKTNVNFFDEIKLTTSYRDFVMKMNIILAQKDVDWSLNLTQIQAEELSLYWDLIKYCFVYFSEFLFEQGINRHDMNKLQGHTARIFLELIHKMIIFVGNVSIDKLYELLWMQVNQELSIVEESQDNGLNVKVRVDDKEYIGADHQLPICLKLLIGASGLLFRNHFGLISAELKYERFLVKVSEDGWLKSLKNGECEVNRIALIEMLILLYFSERRFAKIKGYSANSSIMFLKHHRNFPGLLRSLLHYATNYEENGLLPYSGYFFKSLMESNLYFSALSLNLAIILLENETEISRLEQVNQSKCLSVYLVKQYLSNQSLTEKDDTFIFEDEVFITGVLERISNHLLLYCYKSKTILPNSLKQVISQEPAPRRTHLFIACSAQQKSGHYFPFGKTPK